MAITDVPGIRIGHWTDTGARTGCTVVLLPEAGAVAGVDVRGPAPGTRETDLLQPGKTVERVHAICLCGGSAFGLGAADGVMRFLREREVGLPVGPVRVPLVPAAVLFDLAIGRAAWPGPDDGYAACVAATAEAPAEGAVGAGTGATVGKLLGRAGACPGGVGTASVRLPGGAVVGALAVVNAVGDVHGRDGRLLAGPGGPTAGRPAPGARCSRRDGPSRRPPARTRPSPSWPPTRHWTRRAAGGWPRSRTTGWRSPSGPRTRHTTVRPCSRSAWARRRPTR